jgi:hypothetical protein
MLDGELHENQEFVFRHIPVDEKVLAGRDDVNPKSSVMWRGSLRWQVQAFLGPMGHWPKRLQTN